MPTPNPPETPMETPLGQIFYQGHPGTPSGGQLPATALPATALPATVLPATALPATALI